jgi:hypothetical protein
VGDPIENPALFVEYLLREQMGVADARIDSSSFDTAATARSTWKIAASIKDQRRAEEHLRQICFEFGMILSLLPDSTTGEDRYTLTALPDSTTASDYTVTESDILFTDKPQIEIGYTQGGRIFNDFYVKYFIDYSTGETQKSLYCSDTNGDGAVSNNLSADSGALRGGSYTNWLSESQSRYRSRNPFEVSLEFVRDTATAEKFLKLCADWWAFKRQIVRLKVLKNLVTVDKQIGNILKIDQELVGTDKRAICTYVITQVNFPSYGKTSEAYISWECEEIPNIYTGLPIIKKLATQTKAVM